MGIFMVPATNNNIAINLAWDPNVEPEGDLAGYNLYYSTSTPWGPGVAPLANLGNVTSYSVTLPRRVYYFALKAYDTANVESLTFSNVVNNTL